MCFDVVFDAAAAAGAGGGSCGVYFNLQHCSTGCCGSDVLTAVAAAGLWRGHCFNPEVISGCTKVTMCNGYALRAACVCVCGGHVWVLGGG